jgi:RimJ/RimL family protein N-acetyltransferase
MYHYLEDPDIARNLRTYKYPYPPGEAEKWVKAAHERAAKGEGFAFAIAHKANDLLIGTARIYYDAENSRAEVGYWLGKPFWGQGYITEVVRRLVQYGFEDLKVNRIYATYFARNPASRRVMEKAGMTYEGMYRQHWLKDGVFEDWGVCGILHAEYEAGRGE